MGVIVLTMRVMLLGPPGDTWGQQEAGGHLVSVLCSRTLKGLPWVLGALLPDGAAWLSVTTVTNKPAFLCWLVCVRMCTCAHECRYMCMCMCACVHHTHSHAWPRAHQCLHVRWLLAPAAFTGSPSIGVSQFRL